MNDTMKTYEHKGDTYIEGTYNPTREKTTDEHPGVVAMTNFDDYLASPVKRAVANEKISELFAEYAKVDKGPPRTMPAVGVTFSLSDYKMPAEYDAFMDRFRESVEEIATEILGDVPLKSLDPVESNEVLFDGVAKVESHYYNYSGSGNNYNGEKVIVRPTYFDCFLANCVLARVYFGGSGDFAIQHPFHEYACVNENGDGTATITISNGS